MRTKNLRPRTVALLIVSILFSLPQLADSQSGGSFEISHSTISGGGGQSSSGAFSVTGSIGQYSSGSSTSEGGPFAISTGFWPAVYSPASAWSIGGSIVYGTTPAGQPARSVPGVDLTASGTPLVYATTDQNGVYLLSGLSSGAYTVTPAKTGNVSAINSTDAARIQQYVVGLITFSPYQLIAADANNSGTVNSTDAARIQQYVVGIPTTNIIGQWKFAPSSRNYGSLSSNLSNENFAAILVGEVSGNWTAGSAFSEEDDPAATLEPKTYSDRNWAKDYLTESPLVDVSVQLPTDAMATNGSVITIPIIVGNLTDLNVDAYDFTLFYDPAVLQPASPAHDTTGTLSSSMSVVSNSPLSGRLIISAASVFPIAGSGTLLNLRFNVIGTAGQQTSLSFVNPDTQVNTFMFVDGEPAAITNTGNFTVLGPTAAAAQISGRVLTARGYAISKVRVTLTSMNGETRTTLSNPFGHYRFDNVAVGETYIISVSSRQYTFSYPSQVRDVFEDLSDVDFVADPLW